MLFTYNTDAAGKSLHNAAKNVKKRPRPAGLGLRPCAQIGYNKLGSFGEVRQSTSEAAPAKSLVHSARRARRPAYKNI